MYQLRYLPTELCAALSVLWTVLRAIVRDIDQVEEELHVAYRFKDGYRSGRYIG